MVQKMTRDGVHIGTFGSAFATGMSAVSCWQLIIIIILIICSFAAREHAHKKIEGVNLEKRNRYKKNLYKNNNVFQ